jgi:hypothetical protein
MSISPALARPISMMVMMVPAIYSILANGITNICWNIPFRLSFHIMLPAIVLLFIMLKPIIPAAKYAGYGTVVVVPPTGTP